ncbi:MAG: hypothetical protein LH615_08335, partial [Ferruginibacter sp.]|nr:hypothetical protein [Ferruginibacter sp.]
MPVANIFQCSKDLKFYIDSITDNNDTLLVNGNGKKAVIMRLEVYSLMDETAYLMSIITNKQTIYK